ncbi:MAG: 6-phosphofructokinase [Schwartzia sp.]|nr:6-phosphofructokinase [Schwartzia sp. (in: firmicutes)]
MEKKNTIAIVCGGGPAPGINGVISAVVVEANRNGWDVLGMYDGFSHLAKREKAYVKLTYDEVARIHVTGGCILKMSRYNPTKKEEDLKNVVETLTELGVTHLVTIGGDDTAFSSAAVSRYAAEHGGSINVVHVPKTIDNDLPLPDGVPTFGFETARQFGALEVQNLVEDARTTTNRWYLAIAMGRTAGHLALGIGLSSGAVLTIIPEEFPEEKIPLQRVVDIIVSSVMKRYRIGRTFGVAVVAEGVIEKIAQEDLEKMGSVELDEHGHIRYAELDFGDILKKAVLADLKKLGHSPTIVDKEIGYELRCAAPIAYDIDYARSLGFEAVRFLLRGKTGALISIQNELAVPLYFEDIRDEATGKTQVRRVDTASAHYRIARGFMMRLEKEDLDDAELAKDYKMTPEEFRKRFAYLVEKPAKK